MYYTADQAPKASMKRLLSKAMNTRVFFLTISLKDYQVHPADICGDYSEDCMMK